MGQCRNVSEASRSKYLSADAGTEIKEEDILTYLVWVPRYKYKLFNVEAVEMEAQTIDVVFEDKSVSKSRGVKNGEYLTHPAFTFGDKELNGIWVGKFETTGSISSPCTDELCATANITIKPNANSVINQDVSSKFYATRSMQKNGNIYGFPSSIDTHMMKNLECGAVAYLTQSKYGKNSEVWINNSSQTGCVGNSVSEAPFDGCQNTYDSKIGGNGSTTGNIYGIYDMSGGNLERVMGVQYNQDNKSICINSSNFDLNKVNDPLMDKYLDKYTYGITDRDQAAYNRRLLGDATGEIRGWYSHLSFFIYDGEAWFIRGGNNTSAGIFQFYRTYGGTTGFTFRVVTTGFIS